MSEARDKYGDIIDRERPVSKKHEPMSRMQRAAQFAPYAALTGYDDMIREAARETGERIELDQSAQEEIERSINYLILNKDVKAVFRVFAEDIYKSGGEYTEITGCCRKYDEITNLIYLDNGSFFPISDIYSVRII